MMVRRSGRGKQERVNLSVLSIPDRVYGSWAFSILDCTAHTASSPTPESVQLESPLA